MTVTVSVNIISSSSKEIRDEINRLEIFTETLKKELARRIDGDCFKYGFLTNYGYRGYDTFAEAAKAAQEYYNDPDGGYNVVKVYL
jgi:HD-like signal output (HDOD) protein